MTLALSWKSEAEGIIYWSFEGYWTWGEYFNCIPELEAMGAASGLSRIDILVDLRQSSHIPVDVIQNVRRGSPKTEEEAQTWGLTVVIGGNKFVQTVYTLLCRLRPFLAEHYRLADSPEEALEMIAVHRQGGVI